MGWWNETVFGGDEPLDYLDALGHLIGIEGPDGFMPTPDTWDEYFARAVRAKIGEHGGLDALRETLFDGSVVCDQVLVSVACGSGYDLDDKWKARGKEACAADVRASISDERRRELSGLAHMIDNYNGTPVSQQTVGLFDSLFAPGD